MNRWNVLRSFTFAINRVALLEALVSPVVWVVLFWADERIHGRELLLVILSWLMFMVSIWVMDFANELEDYHT